MLWSLLTSFLMPDLDRRLRHSDAAADGSALISKNEYLTIFGKLGPILELHEAILDKLTPLVLHWDEKRLIGRIFGTASGAAQVGGETHGLVLRGNASDRIIAAVVVRVVKTPHASGVCLTVAARGRARDLSNGVHPHYC